MILTRLKKRAAGALKNFNVPRLHLRVVSDRADGNAKEDFAAFVKSYDGKLGAYRKLLGEVFAGQDRPLKADALPQAGMGI